MYIFTTKDITDLSLEEHAVLRRLCFVDGMMKSHILSRAWKKGDVTIIMVSIDSKIIGWLFMEYYTKHPFGSQKSNPWFDAGVYIHERYRNMGLATTLLHKAKTIAGNTLIKTFPHDEASHNLFVKNKMHMVEDFPSCYPSVTQTLALD